MPSQRHRLAMLSSPRNSSRTIRILSSEVNLRRLLGLISRTVVSRKVLTFGRSLTKGLYYSLVKIKMYIPGNQTESYFILIEMVSLVLVVAPLDASTYTNSIPTSRPRFLEYCWLIGSFQCSCTPKEFNLVPSPFGS